VIEPRPVGPRRKQRRAGTGYTLPTAGTSKKASATTLETISRRRNAPIFRKYIGAATETKMYDPRKPNAPRSSMRYPGTSATEHKSSATARECIS
jgi:hypothetical protein